MLINKLSTIKLFLGHVHMMYFSDCGIRDRNPKHVLGFLPCISLFFYWCGLAPDLDADQLLLNGANSVSWLSTLHGILSAWNTCGSDFTLFYTTHIWNLCSKKYAPQFSVWTTAHIPVGTMGRIIHTVFSQFQQGKCTKIGKKIPASELSFASLHCKHYFKSPLNLNNES